MDYNKFLDLQKRFPFLAKDLSWNTQAPTKPQDIKTLVRERTNFVAIRVFDEAVLKNAPPVPDPSAPNIVEYQIRYMLNWEINPDRTDATFRIPVTNAIGDGSVGAHIDQIHQTFMADDAAIGCHLKFMHIARCVARRMRDGVLTNIQLELFIFPGDFRQNRYRPPPHAQAVGIRSYDSTLPPHPVIPKMT